MTNRIIDIVRDEQGWEVPINSRKRWQAFGNTSSDHYMLNRDADAVDFALAEAHPLRNKVASRLCGELFDVADYEHFHIWHNGRRFRIQIIAGTHGTGPHFHVGVRRA